MKKYFKTVVAVFCFFLCFCRQAENKKKAQLKKVNKNSEKSIKTDYYITGVLDISKDTIVLIGFHGLYLTCNFGKTWVDISSGLSAYDLTIDDKHNLWINLSGGGIHEPRVSMFFKSEDYGKHWDTIEWNAYKFWPREIVSKPHAPLKVKTRENKIYQLVGNDAKKDWKYVGSVKDDTIDPEEHLPPYHIDSFWAGEGYMKLYKNVNNKADTLVRLDSLFNVSNMVTNGDTLYISGCRGGYNGLNINTLKPCIFAVIKEKKVKIYKLPGTGRCATVVRGIENRIWAYNDNNLYLKVKGTFVKLY